MPRLPFLTLAVVAHFAAMAMARPIAPHQENPRYFLFDGKPAFLITSGELYVAVLSLDFDFVP